MPKVEDETWNPIINSIDPYICMRLQVSAY